MRMSWSASSPCSSLNRVPEEITHSPLIKGNFWDRVHASRDRGQLLSCSDPSITATAFRSESANMVMQLPEVRISTRFPLARQSLCSLRGSCGNPWRQAALHSGSNSHSHCHPPSHPSAGDLYGFEGWFRAAPFIRVHVGFRFTFDPSCEAS